MGQSKFAANRRLRIRRAAGDTMFVYVNSIFSKPEDRLKRYRIGDISNKGAFIKMRPVNVHKDMQINLIFVLNFGGVMKLHRIVGIVARVVADGIGVRFLTTSNQKEFKKAVK